MIPQVDAQLVQPGRSTKDAEADTAKAIIWDTKNGKTSQDGGPLKVLSDYQYNLASAVHNQPSLKPNDFSNAVLSLLDKDGIGKNFHSSLQSAFENTNNNTGTLFDAMNNASGAESKINDAAQNYSDQKYHNENFANDTAQTLVNDQVVNPGDANASEVDYLQGYAAYRNQQDELIDQSQQLGINPETLGNDPDPTVNGFNKSLAASLKTEGAGLAPIQQSVIEIAANRGGDAAATQEGKNEGSFLAGIARDGLGAATAAFGGLPAGLSLFAGDAINGAMRAAFPNSPFYKALDAPGNALNAQIASYLKQNPTPFNYPDLPSAESDPLNAPPPPGTPPATNGQ